MSNVLRSLLFVPTDTSITVAELAAQAEERGYHALYLCDHTHIPASRETPYPGGGDLPAEFYRLIDPFVALASAAMTTTTLRLATGVCLVALRDPIALAKQIASLDVICNGRFVFGVGFGWLIEELRDHGVERTQRRDVAREYVAAMRELWMSEPALFRGPNVSFAECSALPKPIQASGPPVLLGCGPGPVNFQHIVEWADGWLPGGETDLEQWVPALRKQADAAGRDPSTLSVSVFGAPPSRTPWSLYEDLGIREAILPLSTLPRDGVLSALDALDKQVMESL